jgi:hypothetical protein
MASGEPAPLTDVGGRETEGSAPWLKRCSGRELKPPVPAPCGQLRE